MERTVLISRNIILETEPLPVYGAIQIQGDRIYKVQTYPIDKNISELMQEYDDWNPQNLEQYCISPGIIDLNVQTDGGPTGYSDTSKAAVAGGVTLYTEHPNIYGEAPVDDTVFWDVAKLQLVTQETEKIITPDADTIGFKGYLTSPTPVIFPILEFQSTDSFNHIIRYDLPIFIDISVHEMARLEDHSPYHFSSPDERIIGKKRSSEFAESAPLPIVEVVDSYSEDDELDIYENNIVRTTSQPDWEKIIEETRQRSDTQDVSMSDKITKDLGKKDHAKCISIFDDLQKRIKRAEYSIESLAKAEKVSYTGVPIKYRSQSVIYEAPEQLIDAAPLPQVPLKRCDTASPFELSPPSKPMASPALKRFQNRLAPILCIPPKRAELLSETSYINYLSTIPCDQEFNGLKKLRPYFREHQNAKFHLCNISEPKTITEILKLQQSNSKLTMDVPIHNLQFCDEDVHYKETRLKTFPPIRTTVQKELLWECVFMNYVPAISSQHINPRDIMKFELQGDFKKAANGINGVGFSLQVIWTKIREKFSRDSNQLKRYLVRISRYLSLHPARVLNLSESRGSIIEGKFADIIVWKPYERMIRQDSTSVYAEQELYGKIWTVLVRGKPSYHKGEFFQQGKFISKSEEFNKTV